VLEIVRNELETMSQSEDPPTASEVRADSPRNDEPAKVVSKASHAENYDTFIYSMPGAFDV
jgi:hypothetical protein